MNVKAITAPVAKAIKAPIEASAKKQNLTFSEEMQQSDKQKNLVQELNLWTWN